MALELSVAQYEFGWYIQATETKPNGVISIYGNDFVMAVLVEKTIVEYRQILKDNGANEQPANYISYFPDQATAEAILPQINDLLNNALSHPYNPIDIEGKVGY